MKLTKKPAVKLSNNKGVRKEVLGLKSPLELDILRKLYYLRKGV